MSEHRKNALVIIGLVMAAIVTFMSYSLESKDLFIGLATLWAREVVGTLINHYYGSSHKRNEGNDDAKNS